ncbi:MAG: hypothetical protein CSA66_04125 [Proteobacteria bacterium]|nr:MAG: hypothetical protein CSA66_04125 [Pseudomonadota bacterium]
MRPRWIGPAAALALALAPVLPGAAGCEVDASDLASFLDTPYGDVTAKVTTLRDDQIEVVMSDLMLRFRSYLALRELVPLSALAPEACRSDVEGGFDRLAFSADVNCVFGDRYAPADGVIRVTQRLLAQEPQVIELVVDYHRVVVGELEVDGRERVEQTDAVGGASVRDLDVVQDGFDFDYEFRLGLLDDDTPVFDYRVGAPDGGAIARISNPSSVGGFVTVLLIGIDGTLECEVRDAAWAPGDAARGLCDNGAVFGLP